MAICTTPLNNQSLIALGEYVFNDLYPHWKFFYQQMNFIVHICTTACVKPATRHVYESVAAKVTAVLLMHSGIPITPIYRSDADHNLLFQ